MWCDAAIFVVGTKLKVKDNTNIIISVKLQCKSQAHHSKSVTSHALFSMKFFMCNDSIAIQSMHCGYRVYSQLSIGRF